MLLLPLLGGYFFIHFFYLTRFRAYRLSSYRLLFETAGAGMIFLVVSHVFVTWLSQATCFLPWIHTFKRFAPFPYSGSAVGALCLSVVAVLTLNLLVGRERSSTRDSRPLPERETVKPQSEWFGLEDGGRCQKLGNALFWKLTHEDQRDVPVSAENGITLHQPGNGTDRIAQKLGLSRIGPQREKKFLVSHRF